MAGKNVLLTGAAGGLGAESVFTLLRAGANVLALDNNAEKLADLGARIDSEDLAGMFPCEADLSELARLKALLVEQSDRLGGFDIVVNNAAIYPSKPFEEYSMEEHLAVQRVNVDAGIVCVQSALPHMRERNWGRIINVTSITAYGGWANLSPYVQSKGAMMGLTRAWAREFGPHGITVNAISPGAIPTDAERIHPNPEAYARHVLNHQAIKRRGTPADFASALMFFCSEESGFVSGQTLNVDGGWVMS